MIVAFAAPVHALLGFVAGEQVFEAGGRALAALGRVYDDSGSGPAHGWGAAQDLADQTLRHRVAQVPADDFARIAVGPRYHDTAHFGHVLGLLPAVARLGADAQPPPGCCESRPF